MWLIQWNVPHIDSEASQSQDLLAQLAEIRLLSRQGRHQSTKEY